MLATLFTAVGFRSTRQRRAKLISTTRMVRQVLVRVNEKTRPARKTLAPDPLPDNYLKTLGLPPFFADIRTFWKTLAKPMGAS